MRVWCREDYDRENTCAALGMNLPGYDKLLGSARKLLRRELQTVERGYFEPNSSRQIWRRHGSGPRVRGAQGPPGARTRKEGVEVDACWRRSWSRAW